MEYDKIVIINGDKIVKRNELTEIFEDEIFFEDILGEIRNEIYLWSFI